MEELRKDSLKSRVLRLKLRLRLMESKNYSRLKVEMSNEKIEDHMESKNTSERLENYCHSLEKRKVVRGCPKVGRKRGRRVSTPNERWKTIKRISQESKKERHFR